MVKTHDASHGKQLQGVKQLSAKASDFSPHSPGNAICTSKSNDSDSHYCQRSVDRQEKREEEHIRTLRYTI